MKTNPWRIASRLLWGSATICLTAFDPLAASAQLYAAAGGSVQVYDLSGSLENPALFSPGAVTGLTIDPASGNLFYAQTSGIGGATSSGASLFSISTGNNVDLGIVQYGGNLYVAQQSTTLGGGTSIAEYSESGALINPAVITGLQFSGLPFVQVGLAINSAGDLFIGQPGNGTVAEYTVSGSLVNSALISGLGSISPAGLALDNSGNILLADPAGEFVGEYTPAGGLIRSIANSSADEAVAINPNNGNVFVGTQFGLFQYTESGTSVSAPGFGGPFTPIEAMAIAPTPEPSALALIGLGVGTAWQLRLRRKLG